jgi:hypothetical protein
MRWVADGVIPPPHTVPPKLWWFATDIVHAACAAEARRLWRPFSKIHRHKFTGAEMAKQLAEAHGQPWVKDLSRFDFDGLLGLLIDVAHDRGAVEQMALAIREKLAQAGLLESATT